MTASRRWVCPPAWRDLAPFLGAGLMLSLCGILGGCVSSSDVSGSSSSSNRLARSPDSQDLVTASDETDHARRARIRLELASAYFAQGQSATALDEVKRALAVDPELVAGYNLRGLIYASLGEPVLAESSFQRALSLRRDDADVLQNFGWFLCQQRRYEEALRQFKAALASPGQREPQKTLLAQGICEARKGDWGAAEKSLLASYELDAGNPATAVNLAEVLLRLGQPDRARFYVQRVNQTAEWVNAQTLWLAARIERRRGNRDGTNEWGQQLRTRFPGSREAAAFDQGRFDE
ncbi:MAG: type IV pilus biogenesis/stability protein PilW [Burkholderiales bacterium]|nr:type IV pilus biogenesis/stability protein PilW [Burkholderiales bacterium]